MNKCSIKDGIRSDGTIALPKRKQMRWEFEKMVKETPLFADNPPLDAMEINGSFDHYMNAEIDTLWIGYALGRRFSVRNADALARQSRQNKESEI